MGQMAVMSGVIRFVMHRMVHHVMLGMTLSLRLVVAGMVFERMLFVIVHDYLGTGESRKYVLVFTRKSIENSALLF
jgi:hypothetical protein